MRKYHARFGGGPMEKCLCKATHQRPTLPLPETKLWGWHQASLRRDALGLPASSGNFSRQVVGQGDFDRP